MKILRYNNFFKENVQPFTGDEEVQLQPEEDKLNIDQYNQLRLWDIDDDSFKTEDEKKRDLKVKKIHDDLIKKIKKEPKVEEVRQPTPIEIGDWVEIFDFNDLNKNQKKFLKSKPYHYVKAVTNSKGNIYEVGDPHIDIGYKIPFKMCRFKKTEKPDSKYKVLFIQFDLAIDTHGEKDVYNFFRGFENMSGLFPVLFYEKMKDDVFVNFVNYDDIYKIKKDYYAHGICLKDYNFVFFGHVSNFTSLCKMIVNYLNRNDIPYLKYGTYSEYDNKAYEFDLLENLGYPYIPSIMTTKLTNKIISIVENDFGFPVIVKDVKANRGTGVFLIKDLKNLIKTFSHRYSSNLMLIQKFIPNDGDYRVITIKNKVELIIKKKRIDEKEFRSNVARGAKAIKGKLPSNIIKMCEDVSKHLDSDILGFDIIQNKNTKEYYIMEVNSASHFSTFSVISGVNIPEIIVNYIIKKIKNN